MKKYLLTSFLIFTTFILFASEIIEIPFHYDNEKKSIFIYAEIAGKKGYFLFDTGAFASIFFDKQETYKNFQNLVENRNLTFSTTEMSASAYYLDTVALASNKLKINSYFLVSEDANIVPFFRGALGIIGLNIFKDKMFEISMSDSVIRIHDKKPEQYEAFLPIQDYSPDELKMFIPITVDGKTHKAFVDTGASYGGGIMLLPITNIENTNHRTIKTFTEGQIPYPDTFVIKKRKC